MRSVLMEERAIPQAVDVSHASAPLAVVLNILRALDGLQAGILVVIAVQPFTHILLPKSSLYSFFRFSHISLPVIPSDGLRIESESRRMYFTWHQNGMVSSSTSRIPSGAACWLLPPAFSSRNSTSSASTSVM